MKLVKKELRLSTSILTPLFLLFAFMALIPRYPALVGAFFICFGIFQSYQPARENNDILYSALLPIRKREVVTAKYLTALFFELAGWLLMALCVLLRVRALSASPVYADSPLLPANFSYLGGALLIFTLFNTLFLGGFFKTAYKFGGPFLRFGIVTLLLIFVGEALHFFPGLGFLNAPAGERLGLQFALLAVAAVIYALGTFLSCRASMARFEKIDL